MKGSTLSRFRGLGVAAAVTCATWSLMIQTQAQALKDGSQDAMIILITKDKATADKVLASLQKMQLDDSKLLAKGPTGQKGSLSPATLDRTISNSKLPASTASAGDYVKISTVFSDKNLDDLKASLKSVDSKLYTLQKASLTADASEVKNHAVFNTKDKATADKVMAALQKMQADDSKLLAKGPTGQKGSLSAASLDRAISDSKLPASTASAGDYVKIETIYHARNLDDLKASLKSVDSKLYNLQTSTTK